MVYLAGISRIFLNLAGDYAAPSGPALTDEPFALAPLAPAPSAPAGSMAHHATGLAADAGVSCPLCGAPAEPDDAFCGECGADLPRGA
jgi:hypothetical protein